MIIIGVDFHPSFQQIAFMDQETGECGDRRLNHSDGEAERFGELIGVVGVAYKLPQNSPAWNCWSGANPETSTRLFGPPPAGPFGQASPPKHGPGPATRPLS
jgi:hypothetical protein